MDLINQITIADSPDHDSLDDENDLCFYLTEALDWKQTVLEGKNDVKYLADNALQDFKEYLHSQRWLNNQ